jgi:probable rRNA maturation factor
MSRNVSGELIVRNHQRAFPLDVRLLRRLTLELLQSWLGRHKFDLGIHLLSSPEMVRLNETFLRHQGSTDVITFDYTEPPGQGSLCGEIFISVEEARIQAHRFRTTVQDELIRYIIHGVLHLCGYDDQSPANRRIMKRQENRLLARLAGPAVVLRFQKPRLEKPRRHA